MHTEPDSLPLGTVLASKYRLDKLIGKGGFGAVFRATRTPGGAAVAVKVLSRGVLEQAGGIGRFRREAELASRLNHPNTVRVLDAGEDNRGWLFIAFELLEGRSVEQALNEQGAMPVERAVAIVADALSALQEAHSLGIVHRDIKPANIFLARTVAGESVKVLDFGIAKSTKPGTLAGLTQVGAAMGTPVYMAPEQILGQAVSDRSDLFAIGIVLADMVVGVSPWGNEPNAIEVVTQRIGGKPVPLPARVAGTRLGEIIHRATQLDPAQRFGSAAEMRAALLAIGPAASQELATPSKRASLAATFRADEAPSPSKRAELAATVNSNESGTPSRLNQLAATFKTDEAPSPSKVNRLAATVNSNDAPSPSNRLAATVNANTPFTSAPTQPGSLRSITGPPREEAPKSWLQPPPTIRESSPSSVSSNPPVAGTIEMPTPFAGQAAHKPQKRSNFGRWFALAGFVSLAAAIGVAAYMRAGPFAEWLGSGKPKKPHVARDVAPVLEASSEAAPSASAAPAPSTSSSTSASPSASAVGADSIHVRPCEAIDGMTAADLAALVGRKGKQIQGPASACAGSQSNIDGVVRCSSLEGTGYTLGNGETIVLYDLRDTKDREDLIAFVMHQHGPHLLELGKKRAADLRMPLEEASLVVGDVSRETVTVV